MIDPVLRPVLEVFEAELREQAPLVATALIECGELADPEARRARMDDIYRYAHSMKGNAGTLGLVDLQALAHAVEGLLVPFRKGERPLPPDLAQVLLAALDQCPRRVADALAGADGPDASVEELTSSLKRMAEAGAGHDASEPASAATAPAVAPAAASTAAASSAAIAAEAATASSTVAASSLASASATAGSEAEAQVPRRRSEDRAPDRAEATLRVPLERLTRLDAVMDELRDGRGALDHRVEQARRLYWGLEDAVANAPDEARAPLRKVRDQVRSLMRALAQDVSELGARLGDADEELRALRMLPLETVLLPLPRAVWEHAQSVGKKVRFTSRGAQVALDRRLLDELKDPLVHLVRNAVDHGLETPEERRAQGKPLEGQILVEAEQRGPRVLLSLSDDGRGVSLERVRAAAVHKGLLSPEAANALDDDSAHELLFSPGFSTASQVSMTSGRGVGLDVVRDRLLKVGGKVSVQSRPGEGTRFVLDLPLTLATQQALLVEAGGQLLALPLSSVHSAHHATATRGRAPREVTIEGQPLPLRPLAQLLGGQVRDGLRQSFPAVALRTGDRLLALRVDRLLGEREVVLRPLPKELSRLRHLSAAASLGEGRVVFVLTPRALGELDAAMSSAVAGSSESAAPSLRPRVLVADDSVTTRALHRQVLEAAGFEVDTAADGEDAWQKLGTGGVGTRPYQLLVSDIRMPKLDGVSLCERVRNDARWTALPVVLVSSLDAPEDRQRAERAGATALLAKAAYERGELVRLVRGLLK